MKDFETIALQNTIALEKSTDPAEQQMMVALNKVIESPESSKFNQAVANIGILRLTSDPRWQTVLQLHEDRLRKKISRSSSPANTNRNLARVAVADDIATCLEGVSKIQQIRIKNGQIPFGTF